MCRALAVVLFVVMFISSPSADPSEGQVPGKKAPGFNLSVLGADRDTTLRLHDLVGRRAKEPASIVLVCFFATWCKPCKAEMPILQKIHEELGPRGVRILSVVVEGADDRPQKEILDEVKTWVKKHGVTFPILYDPFLKDVVAKRYLGQSMQLPGIYLVGSDGRIKAVWHEKREDLKKLVQGYLEFGGR